MTLGNILAGMITKLVVAFINLAVLVVSARYLGAASRGEISVFLLNIALVQLVNEIYTGYSLVHFIPRFDSRRIIIGGIVSAAFVVPAANVLIAAAGRQVNGQEIMAVITSFLVVLNTFNCVLLLGRQKIRAYNFLSVLQPALLLTGVLLCVFWYGIFTFSAFLFPLIASFLIAGLASSLAIFRLPRRHGDFRLAPLLRQGFYYQSAVIMFLLANRFSYYVLPDAQQVGVYAAASSIMDAALLLASGMAPAMLSRVANDPDPAGNAMLTLALAKFSFVITLCCVAILLLLPPGVFTAVLGSGFSGLHSAMSAYAPGLLFAGFLVPLASFFIAGGQQRTVLQCYGLGLLCTVMFAGVLIGRWQVVGAGYTAGVAYLVMFVFLTFAFMKKGNIRLPRLFSLRPDALLLYKTLKGKT